MFLEWFLENDFNIEECIGVDEVGCGPLAGPVVSCAVWMSENAAKSLELLKTSMPVKDSKKLSHAQRQRVVEWVNNQPFDKVLYGIGFANVEEIDSMNIRNATLLSMKRAYENLERKMPKASGFFNKVRVVLIDGNVVPNLFDEAGKRELREVRAIVKGDSKILIAALASIIAKEFRDNIMKELALKYPNYGWDTNVGYGTQKHVEAIKQFGITDHHRKSFAPVKEYLK